MVGFQWGRTRQCVLPGQLVSAMHNAAVGMASPAEDPSTNLDFDIQAHDARAFTKYLRSPQVKGTKDAISPYSLVYSLSIDKNPYLH